MTESVIYWIIRLDIMPNWLKDMRKKYVNE